jgi:hypothetical protein
MTSLENLLISGNAPTKYPTDVFFAVLWQNDEDALEIPPLHPCSGEWGCPLSIQLSEQDVAILPQTIDMVWLSIVERKFYSLVKKLPVERLEELFGQADEDTGEPLFKHIVVGMAPYGGVALWIHRFKKSTLVAWMHGEETQVEMNDFMPLNPDVTLDENCDFYINNDSRVKENLQQNGLPPRDLFDNYMKQFTYRYLPLFEHWDEDEEKWQPFTDEEQEAKPELDYIEEALYDGTHDKLHDGGLLNYHEAGKPKKLAVKWHIKKSEYMAYFWFEDEAVRAIFDKFYGIHPETKTDLIIHVDSIKKKYQLSLFRYGLQEPKIISEDAYQLIVFKNKFEHFRSKNYDQPRGAWIW